MLTRIRGQIAGLLSAAVVSLPTLAEDIELVGADGAADVSIDPDADVAPGDAVVGGFGLLLRDSDAMVRAKCGAPEGPRAL